MTKIFKRSYKSYNKAMFDITIQDGINTIVITTDYSNLAKRYTIFIDIFKNKIQENCYYKTVYKSLKKEVDSLIKDYNENKIINLKDYKIKKAVNK